MSSQNEVQQQQKELDIKSIFDNYTLRLLDILSKKYLKKKIKQIKRKSYDFIHYCTKNQNIIYQMIDWGIKNNIFHSMYQKHLALFSIEALTGEMGQSSKLFIDQHESYALNFCQNNSQIQQEIQGQYNYNDKPPKDKYSVINYLLQYTEKPPQQIQPISINYIIKILSNLLSTNPLDIYAFFSQQYNHKNNTNSFSSTQPLTHKPKLQYFLTQITTYPCISQFLSKLITEQTQSPKYLDLKKYIIQRISHLLVQQQQLKNIPQNYKLLIDFINTIFTKFKSKQNTTNQSIKNILNQFYAQHILTFFTSHIIKSTKMANQIINPSTNIPSPTTQLNKQHELQILQNIFENSINYIKIVIDKLNLDQDTTQIQNSKISQPSLQFQADEALFGQSILDQLMRLIIPFSFTNINKMTYYQILLKLTQNSRFHKPHLGLLQQSLQPILTHLLYTFRKQYKGNGLVKFYIQQLISQAILPNIDKLNQKQAMKVISAFNPAEDVLAKFDDYRVFTSKILIILEKKCQWFSQHFSKFGLNLHQIKQNYHVKLGGNSSIFQNLKCIIKQFEFLDQDTKQQGTKKKQFHEQKFNDDYQSNSSSSHQKQQQIQQDNLNQKDDQHPQQNYFKINFDTQLDDKYNSITKNNNTKNQYPQIQQDIDIVNQQLGLSSKIQQEQNYSQQHYHQYGMSQQNKLDKNGDNQELILRIDSSGQDNSDSQNQQIIHDDVKNQQDLNP